MTKLTFDDISEKTIPQDEAWHVQIKSPELMNKEFDTTWENIKPLFVGKVPKLTWYKLEKDATGKWNRVIYPASEVTTQEKVG